MRGYVNALRHLTQGRGTFTLEFRRYELVPERQSAQILESSSTLSPQSTKPYLT
jgi:translation elongation factor EF-G